MNKIHLHRSSIDFGLSLRFLKETPADFVLILLKSLTDFVVLRGGMWCSDVGCLHRRETDEL